MSNLQTVMPQAAYGQEGGRSLRKIKKAKLLWQGPSALSKRKKWSKLVKPGPQRHDWMRYEMIPGSVRFSRLCTEWGTFVLADGILGVEAHAVLVVRTTLRSAQSSQHALPEEFK